MKPGGKPGGPPITKHKGKGGKQEMLPSRHAVAQLTSGDPAKQSINNYSKLTPSGAGAPGNYADIAEMAKAGSVIPRMR